MYIKSTDRLFCVSHSIGANDAREWRLARLAFSDSVSIYPSCTLDGRFLFDFYIFLLVEYRRSPTVSYSSFVSIFLIIRILLLISIYNNSNSLLRFLVCLLRCIHCKNTRLSQIRTLIKKDLLIIK